MMKSLSKLVVGLLGQVQVLLLQGRACPPAVSRVGLVSFMQALGSIVLHGKP